MINKIVVLACLSFMTLVSCAQNNVQNYEGEWIGFLPNKRSFNFQVSLEKLGSKTYRLTLDNDKTLINENVISSEDNKIHFNLDQQLFFNLEYNQKQDELTGYIKTGKFYYYVSLKDIGDNKFSGIWNPFMLDNGLQSDDIMLYVENTESGNLAAYPFFGDQRFRGTWTSGFKRKGETLLFRDGNTGFNFRAKLLKKTIELEILLADAFITKTSLKHTNEGWDYNRDEVDQSQNTNTPAQLNDGWSTANIKDYGIDEHQLSRLIDSIHSNNTLVNTHSVLIAKQNKLVFENYYDGFNAEIPHDLRSASKSISSAIIGIAIDDNIIESVDERLYDYIPEKYQYTRDSLKSKITIKDLLTMSSGIDVNDKASEDTYQDPRYSNNWLKTVLEASMVNAPGTYADYGSANPFLLGVYLNERLEMPLESYMHEKLFAPLGVKNYINQADDTETIPYFGGGMLLTPRDLLKFGQLYLNNGRWNGKQIISENWVKESVTKHVQLQDVQDKNEYGYFWWHDTYAVNGKSIKCIEARGAGGQFIFIIPELESVVVITTGNFRNRRGNQPRDILKKYILPALIN
ncbi:serine hydrolase domain-containing protein [Winogradskyella sp. PE311]|uniref:serine hydrolase domain-containing protein n=1 Tax=Winogradskyella sp. PE311 TaxID=3366943 RepID=UPI00397F30CC